MRPRRRVSIIQPSDRERIGERHDLGTREAHAGDERGEPEAVGDPAIAGMKAGAGRIHVDEPPGDGVPERPESQDDRGRAGRDAPDALHPVAAPLGVEGEQGVGGVIANRGQVVDERARIPAAAAGLGRHVHRTQRIPEPCRVHLDGCGAPPRRPPPLELVDGQIDARAEENLEGTLHAVLANEPREVPALAAGQREEAAIGALGVRIDGPRDQVEEVCLAPGQPLAHHRRRVVDRQRTAQMTRHATEEAHGQAEVPEGDPVPHERLRHAGPAEAAPMARPGLEGRDLVPPGRGRRPRSEGVVGEHPPPRGPRGRSARTREA